MVTVPSLRFGIDDPAAPDVSLLIHELDGHLGTAHTQEARQPSATFLTARVDGTPVACGAFVQHDGYAEVKRMYVLPACRGLGLGRQLLEALEAEIARTGSSLVRLETGTSQQEALELYGHAGYRRCPPFGEHRANPGSICMEKTLA